MNNLAPIAIPCQIENQTSQAEFNNASVESQKNIQYLKLINFMRRKLKNEMNSFAHTQKIDVPPLNVLISSKVEEFIPNSFRFLLSAFEPKTPNLFSNYFDKVVVDVGDQHFEWTRNIESLELDGIEFILTNPTSPISVSYALYPDFPVTYYIVPDDLRGITNSNFDCLAKIVKSISHYASTEKLIEKNLVNCDDALRTAFGVEQIPLNQLPIVLKTHLLPLPPVKVNFLLDEKRPIYNINIKLPNFSNLPQHENPLVNADIQLELNKFAREKENVDLMAAITRNPFEAIEAEITGHATHCELSDEANDKGPVISIDPMNAARRSTPFYWQSWVSDYAARFLEENKTIHQRYEKK